LRAGYSQIVLTVGAPELPPGGSVRSKAARGARLVSFHAARALPLGERSPLAFNLQAYARR
jgi:hypothetical protein